MSTARLLKPGITITPVGENWGVTVVTPHTVKGELRVYSLPVFGSLDRARGAALHLQTELQAGGLEMAIKEIVAQ